MNELKILPLIFLFSSWLAGFWLVENFFPNWPKLFKTAWGLIWGLLISTLIIFCLALAGNLSLLTISLGNGIFLAGAVWTRWLNRRHDKKQKSLAFNEKLHLLSLLIFWGAIFGRLYFQALWTNNDGLWASGRTVWGDWAVHLGYINSFVYGNNFPPEYPILSGVKLTYPFAVDLTTAIFIKLGLRLETAIGLINWLLSLALIVILWQMIKRFIKNNQVACWGINAGLLAGGLGFINWFEDIKNVGFFKALIYPMREYTHIAEQKIEFINPIFSSLLPQRSVLYGWPLWLMVVILWDLSLAKKNSRLSWLSGVLAGILVIIHPHSALALLMIMPIWWLLFWRKRADRFSYWIRWLMPFSLLAFLGYFWLGGEIIKNSWRWQLGWLAETKSLTEIGWFWLINLGVGGIFILTALLDKHIPLKTKKACLAWLPLFIIPNLIVFQPWDYDNSKFFQWWYILSIPWAIYWLSRHPKKIIVVGFCLMIFSGSLDIWNSILINKNRLLMADKQAVALAEFIKNNTPKKSVFATANDHLNPITMLAGRKVVKGYSGWLWSYGLNYQSRELALKQIYQGETSSAELLNYYAVDYLLIGPVERAEFNPNEQFFLNNFHLIYDQGKYKIFKVRENY